MQRGSCGATKRDRQIHEIWVLSDPLVCLSGAHGPPEDSEEMFDTKMRIYELILGSYIIIK